MFVKHKFILNDEIQNHLRSLEPDFGYDSFGEFIFYKNYSRIKEDGNQECWADTVIRVVSGVFSIRYDWYKRNYIPIDE